MSYDYAGSWDSVAGHQSNLFASKSDPDSTPFSTSKAVNHYKERGISPSKIILGMPLYGRAFASTDGPGTSFSGTGEGSWEQGVWDFKALPQDGAQEHFSDEIVASWSYDHNKRLMISYDTIKSGKCKVEFVKDQGLGGVMWWESSEDKTGENSLIGAVSISMFLRVPESDGCVRLLNAWGASTVAVIDCHTLNLNSTTYGEDSQMSKTDFASEAGKSVFLL